MKPHFMIRTRVTHNLEPGLQKDDEDFIFLKDLHFPILVIIFMAEY